MADGEGLAMRLAKATQLHREGARLMDEGQRDEAERQLRMAMATLEEGDDGIEFAAIAHDLGSLLAGRMEVDEAAGLYERSLAARRRILGSDHPDVAATLHNWAVLCQSAGRLEEANVLWDQAGAILAGAPSVSELDVTETSTTGRARLDAIQ